MNLRLAEGIDPEMAGAFDGITLYLKEAQW